MIQSKLQLMNIISSMAATKEKGRWLAVVAFLLYLILLSYFLFFSEGMGRTAELEYRYNLTLFQEIKRFWNNANVLGWKAVIVNVIGNVVAFMPFGYFIPRICKIKIGVISIILFSFEFSVLVEFVQLITKLGCFDVDDLFLNTVGGFLGYVCYYIVYGRKRRSGTKKKA